MSLDKKLFKSVATTSTTTIAEQGLVLHLDANDEDSIEQGGANTGNGSGTWFDISTHDSNVPLVDKGTDLVLHLNASDTASYSGSGNTWKDLSTYGNDAAKVDSPTYGADTRGYFDLDGSNDRFLISNDSSMFMTSNTGFAIELWVNRDSNAEMYFITPRDNNSYPYTLQWHNNHGYYGWISGSSGGGSVGLGDTSSNGVGEWDHVVLTQSSSDRKNRLYVNGTLVGTSAAVTGFHSSSADINIGAYYADNVLVDGKIGVVRVYKTELTASEVGQNFRAGNYFNYSSIITSKHVATEGNLYTSSGSQYTYMQVNLNANEYSGSGNSWQDSSGLGRNATINAATYVDDNNSDYFDFAGNTSDPVSISNFSALNTSARTWEFWVWFDTDATNYFGGMWGTNSDNSTKMAIFRMKDSNNAIRASVYDGTGSAVEPTTANNVVKTNEWNHIVFTSDNSDNSFEIYVNGVEKYSSTLSFDINTSSTEDFIIGAGGSYSSNRLDGRVAQFRYYNTALSASEVMTNYNASREIYKNPTLKANFDAANYTSGAWVDSVNSNSGTLNNMTVGANFDKEVGNFFDFLNAGSNPSDNQNITVPDSSSLSPTSTLSIEVIVNPDSFSNHQRIVWKDGSYGLYASASGVYTFFINSTSTVVQTTLNETNKFKHIVCTYDGSHIKIYINGILKNSTSKTGAITDNASNFTIGGDGTGSRYYDGQIGFVRLYEGALTAEQVAQNYLATKNDYPNGFNVTNNNAIFDNTDKAFTFNGSNQYFYNSNYPLNFGTSDYTVIIWFNSDTNNANKSLFSTYNQNGLMINLWNNGTIRHYHSGNAHTEYFTSETISTGTWYQLAVTYDTSSHIGSMYLSTKSTYDSSATTSTATGTGTKNNGNGGTNIGRYNNGFYFDGKIANVRVYQKALSSSEIEAVWNTDKNNIP